MEHIREAKISLYIDTNKQTIEKEFTSVDDLNDFLVDFEMSMLPPESFVPDPSECDKCGGQKLLICPSCVKT